jgi:hypothetical protein
MQAGNVSQPATPHSRPALPIIGKEPKTECGPARWSAHSDSTSVLRVPDRTRIARTVRKRPTGRVRRRRTRPVAARSFEDAIPRAAARWRRSITEVSRRRGSECSRLQYDRNRVDGVACHRIASGLAVQAASGSAERVEPTCSSASPISPSFVLAVLRTFGHQMHEDPP